MLLTAFRDANVYPRGSAEARDRRTPARDSMPVFTIDSDQETRRRGRVLASGFIQTGQQMDFTIPLVELKTGTQVPATGRSDGRTVDARYLMNDGSQRRALRLALAGKGRERSGLLGLHHVWLIAIAGAPALA